MTTPIFLSVDTHPECVHVAYVTLNGECITRVVAAHEGAGWVEVYEDVKNDWTIVRLTGEVQIHSKSGYTRDLLESIAMQPSKETS